MEGFEEAPVEAADNQTELGAESHASPVDPAVDEAFAARAEQWREKALRQPDDRQACVGAITARLAGIVHSDQMLIKRRIENSNASQPEAPAMQSALAAHTGLLRQLHSFMSFEARLEQMGRDAEKREALRRSDPLRRGLR